MGKCTALKYRMMMLGQTCTELDFRFHSSMLDTKMLKEKQKFKEIHDSYVIFITKNDYMKMGLPMYHVERTVQEAGTCKAGKKFQGDGRR